MKRIYKFLSVSWLAIFAFAPNTFKVKFLRLKGHQIGRNVKLGISIYDIKKIKLGDDVKIGNWNIFKNINELNIGTRSTIGKFNYFTCSDYFSQQYNEYAGRVYILNHSAITMRHYFDVQHSITVGAHSLIAGVDTLLFTHQKGMHELNQAKPITIGDYVYVGARSVLLPGTVITGYSIVGAGSVLSGTFEETYGLYMSPRAELVKKLDNNAAYFSSEDPAGPNK